MIGLESDKKANLPKYRRGSQLNCGAHGYWKNSCQPAWRSNFGPSRNIICGRGNHFGEIVPNYHISAQGVKAILSERLYKKNKGKQLGDHPVPEVSYLYGELHPNYHM